MWNIIGFMVTYIVSYASTYSMIGEEIGRSGVETVDNMRLAEY